MTYDPRWSPDWKALVPKPRKHKPRPLSEWEKLRPIHRASTCWRWPTWGALHLRTLADAEHFRSRWLYGTREDPSSFIEELPREVGYHDTYRALIARWEAQDPNDVEMQSPTASLHIAAMKRILAEAESP
ncbi:hypothetical protein [Cyanobium gracile]|uniref:Uncharacterized protein n=1 Tax=Cyanobium gracile (strain ATCC 27147 / PCC 6307) TaxID=292564 RepID=K9PAI1_CYAGP|nr:hypothetical protein [Cyanobium gracile]AFY29604.1 hypothetical protein Cyagr_2498 [Cyanobium gracile PCC 6307]